jgi:hypothetical protein
MLRYEGFVWIGVYRHIIPSLINTDFSEQFRGKQELFMNVCMLLRKTFILETVTHAQETFYCLIYHLLYTLHTVLDHHSVGQQKETSRKNRQLDLRNPWEDAGWTLFHHHFFLPLITYIPVVSDIFFKHFIDKELWYI